MIGDIYNQITMRRSDMSSSEEKKAPPGYFCRGCSLRVSDVLKMSLNVKFGSPNKVGPEKLVFF